MLELSIVILGITQHNTVGPLQLSHDSVKFVYAKTSSLVRRWRPHHYNIVLYTYSAIDLTIRFFLSEQTLPNVT